MTSENRKAGFGSRLSKFISALDYSSSDFIYDNIKDSTEKLRELEARIARLENPKSELKEVRHPQAV